MDEDTIFHNIMISAGVMAGITVLVLLVFLTSLCWEQNQSDAKSCSKQTAVRGRHAKTPFNLCLFIIAISTAATYICEMVIDSVNAVGKRSFHGYPANVANTVQTFCMQTSMLAYMYYCWCRGDRIVEAIFPRLVQPMKWTMYLSPFVFYVQVAIQIINVGFENPASTTKVLLSLNTVFGILPGVVVVMFDSMLLVVFILYMNRTRISEEDSLDSQFLIVSQYGTLTVALGLVALLTAVVAYSQKSAAIYQALSFCAQAIYCWVYICLVAMKIALSSDKRRREQKRRSRLLTALGISGLKAIEERQPSRQSTQQN
ncbi:hypothetical protein HDU78_000633 [Chytriomyces hyalinus]|nr:hypothetical protein HDU78_000633 [Chytriomyces hyalinus]